MKPNKMIKACVALAAVALASHASAITQETANWYGRTITAGTLAIVGANDKVVSSENGTKSMTCTRSTVGTWEKFAATNLSGSYFVFKANNGKYIQVQSNYEVKAVDTHMTTGAIFTASRVGNLTAFKSDLTGLYLSSENGTRAIRANRSSAGSWEQFALNYY
jgi:hypothetical protein